MRTTIENKLITSIVVAIVSVIVIVILSIWQSRRIQDTGAEIKHTNQILYKTQDIFNISEKYELNVKNYLLTGDSDFLDTAGRTRALLPMMIDDLKQLTSGNVEQQDRIDSLAFYLRRNEAAMQQAMQLSQIRNFEGAAGLIASEAMTGTSHRIQTILGDLAAEQQQLLEIRRRTNQHKASELQWVLWTLFGAMALLAVVAFWMMRADTQAAVQSSEEKYKTLFNNSPLPKWIYDQETLRFLEVNDTAIRTYGFSREEFLAMTIADIRPPEDRTRLMQDIEIVRKNPSTYRDSRWRHIKKNGEIIDVDIVAHQVQFDGRPARMIAVSDITDRKRHERQLNQLNVDLSRRASELASSNADLERFAYIASHDLQEPLRMVTSFLQLLQKKYAGQLDGKADQYIHYAVDGAERMKALILDLLEYSRVGSGKEGFGKVDTAVVMSEIGEIFSERIISARATVEIGALPIVWGDKVQLAQLLQNLVSNAIKYHSDRPLCIRVNATEDTGHWKFSVEDNGIGIDPQFFEKIFIIFQRLHNKSDYSGTGIGLAICKKIVERHGGRIWVESSSQKGSTFYFTIMKKP